jgi:penicillin amidase
MTQPPPRSSRRGRWWKISLAGVAVLLLIVVGGGGLYLKWSAARPYPTVEGTIALDGLASEVTVIRDGMGIPHIYASTPHDLFMAQGYVHAQDRFWQMDFWRHIGAGRLAEMFGGDQVDTDAFIRTLGWERLAADDYRAADQRSANLLDAYSEGVNAYISDRAPGALGFEYTILGLAVNRSYRPEPWTPVNTLTWGKVMAWDLSANLAAEIDRSLLLGVLSEERTAQLWPPYPGDRNPYIVSGDDDEGTVTASLAPTTGVQAAVRRATANVSGLYALTGGGFEGIGSNSWAVSGDLSATGAPILANDPHLGIRMPSIWYQVALHCAPVTDDCPYDVTGFSFAGVPGVVIGHNADIAWGFTNLGADTMDLYIEKVNPDDPTQYEYRGEWVDMEVGTETIVVAGGADVEIDVRATRHGPIISGRYDALDDFSDQAGVELPDGHELALRWTALEPGPGIVGFIDGLNRASNWEEFRAAAALFDTPAQNLLYADVAGNIGYQTPGKVPIRSSGDGTIPVPGWTGTNEWVGFVPFEELPSVFNPPSGYIVTANNAVVDGSYPHLLTADWNHGYRARRIVDLITSNPDLDVDGHGLIQADGYDLNAEYLREFVFDAADVPSGTAREALDTLVLWDLQNSADSAGAAVWNATWRAILSLTFDDELPEDVRPGGGNRWFTVMRDLMQRPDDPFWDRVGTSSVEGRDDILLTAFEQAVAELVDRLGSNVESWRWGDLHTATFENESLGQTGIALIDDRFNRGRFPVGGSEDAPNAVGWTATEGYAVDWLPSMRMRVDLGDLSRSVAIHTTGQSGHSGHPHYDDMIALWLVDDTYPMLWTREQVEADAEGTLVLTPRSLRLTQR